MSPCVTMWRFYLEGCTVIVLRQIVLFKIVLVLNHFFFSLLSSALLFCLFMQKWHWSIYFFFLFFIEWHQEWRGELPGSFLWGCGHGWMKCSASWNADWEPGDRRRHKKKRIWLILSTYTVWLTSRRFSAGLYVQCYVKIHTINNGIFLNSTVNALWGMWMSVWNFMVIHPC